MPRVLVTDPFPAPPASIASDLLVIAPHSGVGRVLGLPTRNLQSIAKDALKRNGFGIATPIKAAEVLRCAVSEVLPHEDASAIARHHREIIGAMLRSGIDVEKLSVVGSDRARRAAQIAGRYVELLKRDRLVESEAALDTAAKLNIIRPEKVLIYGYFRARQLPARPEEIEFIDQVAADGSIFYLPLSDAPVFASNREWADLLLSRGWQIENSKSVDPQTNTQRVAAAFASRDKTEFKPVDIEATAYSDLENEVRGTLAQVKAAALSGIKPNSIAIICRNLDLYAKPLIATAREYGVPIDIDCEVPIADTPLGEFVSLVFDVLERRDPDELISGAKTGREGFQYEPTIRLMLHRFGPGLNESQRATAYTKLPNSADAWRAIAADTVEQLETSAELDALKWTGWLKKLFFDWQLRGPDKLASSAADLTAFDRFFDSLEQLSRERGPAPISIAGFAADVADVLANIKTPVHTEHGGVRVLLPNVVVGSEFERLFIVGMAEGILPTPSSDSNVIDFFEVEELRDDGIHFENALEVPRWEALTFYFTLLACRGPIVFSYPQFAGDSEQIASAYFARTGITTPTSPSKNFVSSAEEYRQAYLLQAGKNGDKIIDFARHQFDVESYRESDSPPDKYDGVIDIPIKRTSWSASSLAKIGSCPFRWFASDLLWLKRPAEAETELAPNARGTLLHKTLEIAARTALDSADARAAMLDTLGSAFAEAETLFEPLTVIANWRLIRSEHLQRLERAIAADEFMDSGAVIVATEKEFAAEFCGLTIKGTIDRIDRQADGRLAAIDYKHGSYIGKIKDESGYLKLEVQLPVYTTVALPTLFPDDAHAGGSFYHLSEPKITRGKEVDLENIISRIKTMLEQGNFAVDPDVRHDACEYCEFDIVCRVGPRVALKRDRQ
jgi:RecB family exonuclease